MADAAALVVPAEVDVARVFKLVHQLAGSEECAPGARLAPVAGVLGDIAALCVEVSRVTPRLSEDTLKDCFALPSLTQFVRLGLKRRVCALAFVPGQPEAGAWTHAGAPVQACLSPAASHTPLPSQTPLICFTCRRC